MADSDFFLIKPCKTKAALEIVPKKRAKVELPSAALLLKGKGYDVTDAKVLLIIKAEAEATLYPSGKMLVKTNSEKIASDVANNIYSALLGA